MSSLMRPLALCVLAFFGGVLPAQAALDSTLSTNYSINPLAKTIDWVVCGSLPGSSGCFGGGSIGPFGKIGAMLEGAPSINNAKGTVTRFVYVLDVAAGPNGNQVQLDIFKKVDTFSGGSDSITMTSFNTVTLPLTGGASTSASMAANKTFLYFGTNRDQLAVQVKKSTFAITQFSVISGSLTVSSITSDPYGFVTVTWGPSGGSNGFVTIDPTGRPTVEGGGTPFALNTTQATIPSTLP